MLRISSHGIFYLGLAKRYSFFIAFPWLDDYCPISISRETEELLRRVRKSKEILWHKLETWSFQSPRFHLLQRPKSAFLYGIMVSKKEKVIINFS